MLRLIRFCFSFPDLFRDAKDRSQLLLLLPKAVTIDQGGEEGGEEGGGGAGEGDEGGASCLGEKHSEQDKERKRTSRARNCPKR